MLSTRWLLLHTQPWSFVSYEASCVSVRMPLCLFACLRAFLSECLCVYLSVCLCLFLCLCQFLCPCVCLAELLLSVGVVYSNNQTCISAFLRVWGSVCLCFGLPALLSVSMSVPLWVFCLFVYGRITGASRCGVHKQQIPRLILATQKLPARTNACFAAGVMFDVCLCTLLQRSSWCSPLQLASVHILHASLHEERFHRFHRTCSCKLKGFHPWENILQRFLVKSFLWPPQTECLRQVCIVGVSCVYCWCFMCFHTAYSVLTKYWHEVDGKMDGMPDI